MFIIYSFRSLQSLYWSCSLNCPHYFVFSSHLSAPFSSRHTTPFIFSSRLVAPFSSPLHSHLTALPLAIYFFQFIFIVSFQFDTSCYFVCSNVFTPLYRVILNNNQFFQRLSFVVYTKIYQTGYAECQ